MSISKTTQRVKQLTAELSLSIYNQIPVLQLDHPVGQAKISLQGAQLLSWFPKGSKQDIFWLSEVEPFQTGVAIRGGIPLCYPWFGGKQQPSHGTARLRLWHLSDYQLTQKQVKITFSLFDEHQLPEAKLEIQFDETCQLTFTHYGKEPAQVALHSYFNVADIEKIEIQGLPTQCYNSVNQQQENVPSTRKINSLIDCIYSASSALTKIIDEKWQREIHIEHQNTSNIVLWNPWQNKMSAMSEIGYKTMVCVETARIEKLLQQGESIAVRISPKNNL